MPKTTEKFTKQERIGFAVISIILVVTFLITLIVAVKREKAQLPDIEVTEAEMQNYREMIGDGMDEKRAVFILFNSEEECKAFISEHGADEHPEALGIGVVPMLSEDGYHNIVGKTALEEAFNNLADGEYAKEPVLYADKFCYLKRISCVSPISDDETLRQMIQEDKINQRTEDGK